MKKWMACLALLLPGVVSADFIADPRLAKSDPCGPFEVVHINGVLTDFPEAQANLFRLAAVYGNGHNGHIIVYRLAHNQRRDR